MLEVCDNLFPVCRLLFLISSLIFVLQKKTRDHASSSFDLGSAQASENINEIYRQNSVCDSYDLIVICISDSQCLFLFSSF